jgi:hypothetical protein
MFFETFPSHNNIALSLTTENCYGMKALQVNKSLGFNKNSIITVNEVLALISLKVIAWISSLNEVQLPELLIEESKQQQAIKVMDLQWKSPRKQLDLYLLQNQNSYLLGSISILHPSGYPYTQYNLMELLDANNERFLIGNDWDIGIKLEDAGYGLLNGNDKITVFGTVEKVITTAISTPPFTINLSTSSNVGTTTPPSDIQLSAMSVNENVDANTVIGTFTTIGSSSTAFTYNLVAGFGDTDNSAFTIANNQLLINESPDYETKNSYSIRVRVVDGNNLTYEKSLVLTVNDVIENLYFFNLSVNDTQILDTGTGQINISNNGVILSNSGFNFTGEDNQFLHLTGNVDLSGDFRFIFDIPLYTPDLTHNGESAVSYIADFTEWELAENLSPSVAINHTHLILRNWQHIDKISIPLPKYDNLQCEYRRINGENELIINGIRSAVWTDFSNWTTDDITLGRACWNAYKYRGSLNNIKFITL